MIQIDSLLLDLLIKLAKAAGQVILPYYGSSTKILDIALKKDSSLLTKADLASHEQLFIGLSRLTPGLPILSEEGEIPPFRERCKWGTYWLLDPLDGTQGFVRHLKEFTVNIALISNHCPILGVIYAPVYDLCFYATQGLGAWKQHQDQPPQSIQTKVADINALKIIVGHYLGSDKRLLKFSEQSNGVQMTRLNSSLKFGWIAEGLADVYPRLGKTGEWDTAAGQCILCEAGGAVLDLAGKPLQYNAQDSLINSPFVALGDLNQVESVLQLLSEITQRKNNEETH